jgi:hypothetical protein
MEARMRLIIALFAFAALAQAQSLHVIWDRSGVGDSSLYGYRILPLGDQNDDGYNDWAIFANGNYYYPGNRGNQQSYLEFFHGGNPS